MGNFFRVVDHPDKDQVIFTRIVNPQTVPADQVVYLDTDPTIGAQADGITFILPYYTALAFTTNLPATALPDQYRGNGESLPVQMVAVSGGTPSYSYQWRRGVGQNIGTNSPTLNQTIDATFPAAGNYSISCVVTDSGSPAEQITSNLRAISIYLLPSFSAQPPATLSVAPGAAISIPATGANGKAPRVYSWYKDGSLVAGQTGNTFTKAAAVAEDAGSYVARVTDANGKFIDSTACVLTVTA